MKNTPSPTSVAALSPGTLRSRDDITRPAQLGGRFTAPHSPLRVDHHRFNISRYSFTSRQGIPYTLGIFPSEVGQCKKCGLHRGYTGQAHHLISFQPEMPLRTIESKVSIPRGLLETSRDTFAIQGLGFRVLGSELRV